jgi:hypothetical protein
MKEQDGAAGPVRRFGRRDHAGDVAADSFAPPAQRIAAGLGRPGMEGEAGCIGKRDDPRRADTRACQSKDFAGAADVNAAAGFAHTGAEHAAPRIHRSGNDGRTEPGRAQADLADDIGEKLQRRQALGRAGDAGDQGFDIGEIAPDDEEVRHRIGHDDAGQRP